MSALVFILPLSFILILIAVVVFVLAVCRGQFEDLETPAVQILLDDDRHPPAGEDQTP